MNLCALVKGTWKGGSCMVNQPGDRGVLNMYKKIVKHILDTTYKRTMFEARTGATRTFGE